MSAVTEYKTKEEIFLFYFSISKQNADIDETKLGLSARNKPPSEDGIQYIRQLLRGTSFLMAVLRQSLSFLCIVKEENRQTKRRD